MGRQKEFTAYQLTKVFRGCSATAFLKPGDTWCTPLSGDYTKEWLTHGDSGYPQAARGGSPVIRPPLPVDNHFERTTAFEGRFMVI